MADEIDNNINLFTDNSIRMHDDLQDLVIQEEDQISTGDLRNEYASALQQEPFLLTDRAKEIVQQSVNEPIFRDYDYNEEDMPKKLDIVQIPMDAAVDITTIDNSIINTTNKYTTLIMQTIERLNKVKKRILTNQQRINDINFICDIYNGMKNVIQINDENMTGQYIFSQNTFSAFAPNMKEVGISVTSVDGNGYSGNAHVLNSTGNYVIESDDRSNIENITDNSPITVYEYSRIYSSDPERPAIDDVYYDNKSVRCTISLAGESSFNVLKIESEAKDLHVDDVLISNDGKTYHSALSNHIELTASMYENFNYANGANMVEFPYTKYVKLILSSDQVMNDYDLGCDRVDVTTKDKPDTVIKRIKRSARKAIQIQGITAMECSYQESVMITDNLIPSSGSFKKVAVFANQYIPDGMDMEDNGTSLIKYELLINGAEHTVVPINSNANGVKIISCDEYIYSKSDTEFIDEEIKSLQLRVTISVPDDQFSPLIGNLKVCVG